MAAEHEGREGARRLIRKSILTCLELAISALQSRA
jgi:hypothetical protein